MTYFTVYSKAGGNTESHIVFSVFEFVQSMASPLLLLYVVHVIRNVMVFSLIACNVPPIMHEKMESVEEGEAFLIDCPIFVFLINVDTLLVSVSNCIITGRNKLIKSSSQ